MRKKEVNGVKVNLLSQGLHGCVLNMLPLFSDPVRLIWDQGRHSELHYDENMLETHTEVIVLSGHGVE